MTSKRSVQLKKFLAEKKFESMTDFEIVYDEICRWGKEDKLIVKDLELDENTLHRLLENDQNLSRQNEI